MGLFSNKASYLGVDLGTSSVKVVELSNMNSRPRLVTYGFTERKMIDAGMIGDVSVDIDMAAQTLEEVCQKAKCTSKKAVASLPNFSVFTSILNLPALSKKELASAISWEAKKIIPMPLEDIILDWKIIEEVEESQPAVPATSPEAGVANNQALKKIFSRPQKNVKILLTGASKKLVKKYVDIFNKAGLTLLSLETESFALTRSLIGNDKSVIMMIDLGANTSSISVVDNGVPVLTRSIEVGGLMITKAISTALNVSFSRAEQFKQDMSLGSSDSAENALPQTVDKAFASILNEIKYTLNLYQEQNKKQIEKIVLTGGSAMLGNLPAYLSKVLNINTYVGDSWARVVYPTELKPILDRLGSKFAVSIGLGMRNIES